MSTALSSYSRVGSLSGSMKLSTYFKRCVQSLSKAHKYQLKLIRQGQPVYDLLQSPLAIVADDPPLDKVANLGQLGRFGRCVEDQV